MTDYLSSLPAGPIELHDAAIKNSRTQRVVVLGYALEPGQGHGDNYVHVKPWIKRIEKFKYNLYQKLKAAPPGANFFEIAEKYRRQWFGSQGAWTKVPFHSNDVSSCITMTYVDDFIHGLPIGVWKINKPQLANVKFP